MEVEEVVYLRIFQALDLQLCVGFGVGRNEGRGGNTEHILGKLLLLHQFGPGHSHQLDADAHEADIVDIRRNVRARTRKTNPSPVGARLRIYAVTQLRRDIVVNNKLPSHDALCLRISSAFETSRFPEQLHLLFEALDDRVQVRFFTGNRLFLSDSQAFVRALAVDQSGYQACDRIAKHGIERRTEKWIESAFQMYQGGRSIGQPVQERRAGVGFRYGSIRV